MCARVLHRRGGDTAAAVVNSISVFAERDSPDICEFVLGYLQFDLALDREMVYPPALMKWTNANSCSMTPLAGFAATEASYPRGVARTRRIDVDQALAGRHAR